MKRAIQDSHGRLQVLDPADSVTLPDPVEFAVPGLPVPKGSMRAIVSRTTGRAFAKPDNERELKAWAARVHLCARAAMQGRPLIEGAVRCTLTFVLPPPATRERDWPSIRPDGDKLQRAVWDGLTGAVWLDDGQVCEWPGSKRYCDDGERPGVIVRVDPLPDYRAARRRARAAARKTRAPGD